MAEQYVTRVVTPELHYTTEVARPAVAGYTQNVSVLARGNCEYDYPPTVDGESSANLINATLVHTRERAHSLDWSWKAVKIAGGSASYIYLCDSSLPDDLHGFVPGQTYIAGGWIYVPTITGTNTVQLRFLDFQGSWEDAGVTMQPLNDQWQYITYTRTIRAAATGAMVRFILSTIVAEGEGFFYDDFDIVRVGVSVPEVPKVVLAPSTLRRGVLNATPVNMLEAQFTPPAGQTFERSHVCAICDFTFKESEMSEVDGKWYCNRFHHAEDKRADLE